MEALSGLRAAAGGTITFKEKNITKTTVRQRISDGLAFIPEDRSGCLVRELSVAENASIKSYRLPEFSKGGIVDYKKLNKQAEEFIDKFEIKVGGTKSLVQSMSGGNAQKLILARETASKPDVILASYRCAAWTSRQRRVSTKFWSTKRTAERAFAGVGGL